MKNKKRDDPLVLKFAATVDAVKTATDGGIRITLDISEDLTDIAKQMMDARRAGAVVQIAAIFVTED